MNSNSGKKSVVYHVNDRQAALDKVKLQNLMTENRKIRDAMPGLSITTGTLLISLVLWITLSGPFAWIIGSIIGAFFLCSAIAFGIKLYTYCNNNKEIKALEASTASQNTELQNVINDKNASQQQNGQSVPKVVGEEGTATNSQSQGSNNQSHSINPLVNSAGNGISSS